VPLRYAGQVNAPDFPPGLDWVNVPRPLSLRDLRGKVVVLDFWTYCCINCVHMLPLLRKLGRRYAREVVVVGVHTPKFPGERDPEAVRQAVVRLGVGHPVANDPDHRVRDAYAVRSWPTLMFLDPAGKVIGVHEGEFAYQAVDDLLASMLAEFSAHGRLSRGPLPFELMTGGGEPTGELRFPAKVLADPAGGRLFVSDTGHHRVLEVDPTTGAVRRTFGCGEPGFIGGPAGKARFRDPQGLARHGECLYVADTGNHAVRCVYLDENRVELVAGTGEQARPGQTGGNCPGVPLNSPWDLAISSMGLRLWVAMAGSHQVWEINLTARTAAPWAGGGVEGLTDGPKAEARFAQPSGLALDEAGGRLFIADSEASAIRAVGLAPTDPVRTLVGAGLFEFGDEDGAGDEVRLQHPLGVAVDGIDRLVIADSYNHKVKGLDPDTRRVRTLAGSGLPGLRDGPFAEAQFSEPGGVSVGDGLVYVADTNNHAIRVLDRGRGEVRTLPVRAS
jgi:thiol-disulfide isomerase/thioredoxin